MAEVQRSRQRGNNDIVQRNRKKGVKAAEGKDEVSTLSKVFTKDYSDIELPRSKIEPSDKLSDYSQLIFGDGKIGKTSLSNAFGETFIFAFEPGPKALRSYSSRVITEWELALYYLEMLENENAPYEYFSLDTGPQAYDRCLEYICRRDSIKHPGDVKDYGTSWKEVSKEFYGFHTRLAALQKGFIVISHERTRERKTRAGVKYDRIEPCFSESAEGFYKAIIDIVGYYSIINDRRYLQISPSDFVVAGHRVDGRFLTTEGEPIFRIPMGKSAKEGYENFKNAFHNKQRRTYKTIKGVTN